MTTELSGRYDALHGDEGQVLMSEADQAAEALAVHFKARNLLREDSWWNDSLEGVNSITAELPFLLSKCADRVMQAQACTEPQHAQILHDAMAVDIERFILRVAYERARCEAQSLADAGDLVE